MRSAEGKVILLDNTKAMSHHIFILSPTDTPLYSLTHYSSKPAQSAGSSLSSNLPSWSTSAFAGTLTALSGASSATQVHHTGGGGGVRMGGGQDRHVIQMIANASLDAIEEVMRRENAMYLKSVDRFNEWIVSAFVTAGSQWHSAISLSLSFLSKTDMKFIILHETKNDDGIKVFFNDLWELYLKVRARSAVLFSGYSTVSRRP